MNKKDHKRNSFRKLSVGFSVLSMLLLSACSGKAGDGASSESAGGCEAVDGYPRGPIELVVPFSAGGGTDAVARFLADELGSQLGTKVNVINKTGGGGVVGHQYISKAKNDGQTLGLVTADLAMMHHLGLTDVSPDSVELISQVNEDPAAVTVSADSDFDDVTELVNYAKQNPGELVASGVAQAGIWHVALAGMLMEEGAEPNDIRWVPSEGAAPALQEVVSGGIDISTASLAENRTMIDSGRVKALGVMAEDRIKGFDDVETLKEQGIDYSMSTWRGIAAPSGTDEGILTTLECHLENIVASEEYETYMSDAGQGVIYRNAQEFTDFATQDDKDKGEIIEKAGLKN